MHGWPDTARTWNDVAARLNTAGFRTIVPELRGAGRTPLLGDAAARHGGAVARVHDAIELMDALEIDTFDFVGHDWRAFDVPDFAQSRRWWYQWFMSLDAGPKAVAADPKGFARIAGWYDEAEFAATARVRESRLGADHAQRVSAALAHGRSVRSGAVGALPKARRGREDRRADARDSRRSEYVH